MIDARTELNWKWRGNPSDPFIGALPSNWWKTKQNHRKLWKFAILTQNLDYFNVSIYSLKIQTNFVQKKCYLVAINMGKSWAFGNWPPWIAASRCKMTMVMPCFLRDFHNVRIRADGWNFIHCVVGTLRIECRCNFNV